MCIDIICIYMVAYPMISIVHITRSLGLFEVVTLRGLSCIIRVGLLTIFSRCWPHGAWPWPVWRHSLRRVGAYKKGEMTLRLSQAWQLRICLSIAHGTWSTYYRHSAASPCRNVSRQKNGVGLTCMTGMCIWTVYGYAHSHIMSHSCECSCCDKIDAVVNTKQNESEKTRQSTFWRKKRVTEFIKVFLRLAADNPHRSKTTRVFVDCPGFST